MQIELSAKELAYVTVVVGRAQADETGMNAYDILYDATMTDVQAIMYRHSYEMEMELANYDG